MNYIEKYKKWLDYADLDKDLRDELENISGNDDEIKSRFLKDLSFGTAGLRGVLGGGSDRMNIYTVRQATQGLAEYIKEMHGESRGVAIAYDSRHYSPEFALESAKVLCANGIKVYLFDALRPTPELSFAIRHLGCISGIVITASHNPSKYNGYKAYGEDGGQLPLEAADIVTKKIADIDIFDAIKIISEEEAINKGLLEYIGEDVDKAYLDKVREQAINKDIMAEVKDFKVVYTPFHGTGNMLVQRILKMSGMQNLIVVKEQETPDGDFPTVKSPNPEEKEGFTLAIELAKKNDVDLIIGTDPDCDRVGIVVRDNNGEYITFTGNQVGVLLAEYILSQRKENGTLPENPAIVSTVVSTDMVRVIANAHGVAFDEVLTGFKFIGEKIKEYEDNNHEKNFVFGFEESYGYLSGDYARDKDAVVASMLIVEMAAWFKKRNMTLYDALNQLYAKYGTYEEAVANIYKEGVDGPKIIAELINKFRTNPPKSVGGVEITARRDYNSGKRIDKDGNISEITLPKNNMLYFELGDKGWFALRPSGTEPKFKLYFGYVDMDAKIAKNKIENIKKDVLDIINE